jgi:hypothetical protein
MREQLLCARANADGFVAIAVADEGAATGLATAAAGSQRRSHDREKDLGVTLPMLVVVRGVEHGHGLSFVTTV